MNLSKIGLVISHEYSTRVRKKSFLLTTLLTPLFLGLMIVIPALITIWDGNEHQQVKVIDHSGYFLPFFEDSDNVKFSAAAEGETAEIIKGAFDAMGIYAAVEISDFDANGNVTVDTYSKEPLNIDLKSRISKTVSKAVEERKLAGYKIDGLDRILSEVKTDIKINALTITDEGEAKKDSVEIYMVLSYLMSFMIYMFVFLFGNMVMRSVIDEKSSRVVEVLVSSVKSIELMMGKIIGVALVALTQFAIWVALTIGIISAVNAFAAPKLLEKMGGTEQIVQMAATGNGIHPDDIAAIAGNTEAIQETEASEGPEIIAILSQISGLPWAYILGCFLIYFLLGYLLYSSMFAAIGAAVDNESDTSQLQLPVTVPLLIGIFIMLHTFEHPSSQLSFWASIIPFTSPMVMLARIPFGIVPAWQLILSIALLAATFVGIAYLSARIYKAGILMYGKKSTWKDLWKWIKQKN